MLLHHVCMHDDVYSQYCHSSIQNTSTDNPVYYHNGADYILIQPLSHRRKKTTHLSTNGSITSIQHPEDRGNQELHQSMDHLPPNEVEGLYETPHPVAVNGFTDMGSKAEKDSVNDDYSKLNVRDVRYATLEPHISGNMRNERESTSEEGGYSLLQHAV